MIAIVIILVIIVLAVLFFVFAFNGAVRLRNRVDSAWSQISVQLQRRHDLIPNLLETVKGYAAHERQTLEAVTAARTGAVRAQQAGPAQQAEDRIAYARQFYNDSVQKYNTKIQTFPTVIVAGMFNFQKREFFEAEQGSTEVPKVQF